MRGQTQLCSLVALCLLCCAAQAGAATGSNVILQETVKRQGKLTTLNETVTSVLKNHKALKIIQENRDVAINELARSKAGWGPRVDAQGRAGASNLSNDTTRTNNISMGMYGAGSVGVTLVQPLWDGLATLGRVHASEALLDSVTSRVIDNATSLALDGIIAHVDLIWRRETLRLAENNVKRHKEILASTKDRQNMGADTIADVTQTQGRLARALSTLSQTTASMREGESSYRRLTEAPLPSALQPVRLPAAMFKDTEAIMTLAQQNNPKLVAYLADVRTAQGEKEVAESAYSPVVNLEAGPNYSDRGGRDNQWTSGFDVMGTMRWNIFNSGADVLANRAAAARIRQARQTAMNYVDDLRLQINNTWTQYTASHEQMLHYEEAIRYNTATRDAYMEQFLMGQRSLLDVLDAESELFNSSTQAVTARGNVIVTGYRMFALAGVLLKELHIDPKPLLESPFKEQAAR